MVRIFSTLALMFAAFGPGDPGISDEGEQIDPAVREVSIDGARWEALRALAEFEDPIIEPPGPHAANRLVQIERSTEGIRIVVTWTLEAIDAGWFTGPLIGPMAGMRVESMTWRDRDLGFTSTPSGEDVAIEMAAKSRGALKLTVFIPADQLPGGVDGSVGVWLMPAVRGEVRLKGQAPEGRVPELIADGQPRRRIAGSFWAREAQLSVDWVDPPSTSDVEEGPLAVAQSSVGLTFGDGEVRGRARVTWLLRRGQLAQVAIDTSGLGIDLEVVGPNVHEWSRNGDRIDIVLKEPADGRIDVDLRWTQGLPEGAEAQLAAPRVVPQQAYRTESFMQIARDGELEVLPKLSGWSAMASTELPEWAGGYIQGTATATYRADSGGDSGSFDLLRFVPLSGPPVLVDVAAYDIATTDEGRSLVSARYDVRNERASHLHVSLPKGARMLGVRVSGETVTPTLDANTAWRIPLVRSLESVKGSLSFPVEIIFITEAPAWEKKEARELQLPALDAPVAVSRVRVYLPPNYENRVAMGDFHRVTDFSEGEGITYGLGVGASAGQIERADQLYREALSGWMENDFRRAQSSLDELSQLGASNENIEGLQANLDLVGGRGGKGDEGQAGGGQSAVVSRRIIDQANTRANDDKIALHDKAKEAEELELQGQYDEAEKKLEEAREIGDRLALLEQSESQEQIVYNQSLSSKSERLAEKKKRKVSRESEATKRVSGKGKKDSIVYDFEEDIEQTGEVLSPEETNLDDGFMGGEGGGEGDAHEGEVAAQQPMPGTEMDGKIIDPQSVPIGNTTRDFTAVVEELPMAEPPPPIEEENPLGETTYASESQVISVDVRRGRSKGRPQRQKNAGAKPDAKPASTEPTTPMPTIADPNAALAGPVATASAVTVHIPAIGEAVLYQHMLLPEGEPLTVHLEARRHKNSKQRKSK